MPQRDPLDILLALDSPANQQARLNAIPPTSESAYRTVTRMQNPERNNASVLMLRKFLGLGDDDASLSQYDLETAYDDVLDTQQEQYAAKAQADTLSDRVKGEYGLATQQARNQGTLAAARYNRDAAADERAAAREFTAGQNQLNRDAVTGRVATREAATNARQQTRERGIGQRQRVSQAEQRIRAMEQGKAEPSYPETNGVLDTLKYYLGLGPFDRSTAVRSEADRLRQEALTVPGEGDDITAIASDYLAQFGNLPDDELLDMVIQTQPGASPQEIDALVQAIDGLRGQ